jgi:GR25 family glycosyltransferase involved in LPS biosynthesis
MYILDIFFIVIIQMRVFVVNAYENRKSKYDQRYELFPATWWETVSDEEVERYHFRYNAKLPLRKKVVACSLSHKRLLQKIINEDLKDIIIIEDDAVIENWDRLQELKDVNEFCYIGGDITSPLLKDMKKFKEEGAKDDVRHELIKGINTIDPKIFKIGWTCGYYIPNREVAQMILSNIPNGKKERAVDNEYIALQKKGKINKFIYPAIATLFIKEAEQGFTFSNYKLYDDAYLY